MGERVKKNSIESELVPKICGAVKRTMTLEDEAGKKLRKKDKFQKVGRKIFGF